MTSRDSSAPQGAEIIVPIRVGAPPSARRQTTVRQHPRRMGVGIALMIIAALTAGGIWWIGHLSRHPLDPPPAAPQAETPPTPSSAPLPEVQASAEPRQPSPQPLPAVAALPGPAATRSAEQEFRRWMTEGFAALNAGDLSKAQARFLKAKALRPEAPDVAEALAQTENRMRAARIETARQRALTAEQREDWAGALSAYEEALRMEPTFQFAQQGKERVAALAALERRIAVFVGQPGLLDSDAQLENAARLLQDIQTAPPLGSRLSAEADKFGALLRTAKTPVRVTIASDSLTDISVYRVGKLGRFSARDLSLRPGTYTVVGSRDGFRDERLDLVVKPGPEPILVSVICKERF